MRNLYPLLLLLIGVADPLGAAAQTAPPSPDQIMRLRTVGAVRANVGNSGLRRFLAESASLGELQNRAASYRIIEQVERSRIAGLEGRIAALAAALANPSLPAAERARLQAAIDESRAEIIAVPDYRADYNTATGQAGSLLQLGFAGNRPVFGYVKARVVRRTDPNGHLRVVGERIDIAPVLFPSNRWFVAIGLTASRTDVDVLAFDGTSGSNAAGFRFDVGSLVSDGLAVGVHASQVWVQSDTRVIRPGPQPVPIDSKPSTRTLSFKAEVMGRVGSDNLLGGLVELAPRAGLFFMRTAYEPVTNSLGQTVTGLFGDSDGLALIAGGVAAEFGTGRLRPDVYLGLDHELATDLSEALNERTSIVLGGGVTYRLSRSRRIGATYTEIRSTGGGRRSGELDLVAVLDF